MERSETGGKRAGGNGPERLVIFDCDGVLVDSEVLAIRVLVDAIRRAGARIEEDEAYRLFLGRSLATVTECLRSGFGLEAGPDFLEDMRQALYARFRAELKPVAGMVARVEALMAEEGPELAPRLHVLPDFHGNRAPLADPQATGVVSGLTLDTSFDGLCRLYWRCCVALALGLRHVVDALRDSGTPVETLHLAGGHLDNPLLTGLYADATGCVVMAGTDNTAVLLGTALNAAVAAGLHPDMAAAGAAMIRPGRPHAPDPLRRAARERDYRRFLAMIRHRAELDRME